MLKASEEGLLTFTGVVVAGESSDVCWRDFCNMFVLTTDCPSSDPYPSSCQAWLDLPALWVTGITQAPPPRQGDNPWEETQFSRCQFQIIPKCPAVPVAATSPHLGRYIPLCASRSLYVLLSEISEITKLERLISHP